MTKCVGHFTGVVCGLVLMCFFASVFALFAVVASVVISKKPNE